MVKSQTADLETELKTLASKYEALAKATPAGPHPLIAMGSIAKGSNLNYGGWPILYFAGGKLTVPETSGTLTYYLGIGAQTSEVLGHVFKGAFVHFGFDDGVPNALEVLTAFKNEYASKVPKERFPDLTHNLTPTEFPYGSGSLTFRISGELPSVVESAFEAIKSTTGPVSDRYAQFFREMHT